MAQPSRRRTDVNESVQPSDFPSNRSTIERQQSPRHLIGSSVSSFQHARIEGDVSNNRVYTAGRDLIVNDNDLVTMILLPHVASGAIFDSVERQSAGRCHPGTRQRMIDRAMDWIMATDPAQTILWMHGSAGAGKSSLMQSICELLRDSDREKNGASFFFSRGDPDRGKATKLFVTLAYQLAVQFPSVRAQINHTLHSDPTLPTKSMAIQLQSLIVDPLLRCHDIPSPRPILFIDGLDECDANDDQWVDIQCKIITIISRSLLENNIPIRFMLASRPEYWIRDLFETSPLSDISLLLSLRDDVDADDDIRTYLTEHFEQIRLKKSRVMGSVALPWPPEHIVDRFVEEASGQYVYASTILKFVGGHPHTNPEKQLQILTTPGPHRAPAYSELDRLYATIVSACPEWDTMKHVLGGLLINVNLAAIQVILEVPRSEITLVLDALCSLIDVIPPTPLSEDDQLLIPIFGPSFEDEEISFFHLSFCEFLLDKARSGSYHIDIEEVRSKVISAFFGIIQRNLNENYKFEPHISCSLSLSEYHRMMYSTIEVVYSDFYDFSHFSPLLHGMMETFRSFDPARRMDHPACFMRDMDLLLAFLKKLDQEFFHQMERRKDNPDWDSFVAIVSQIQSLASMGRKIGIHLLSLCGRFNVTQTLFLLRYPQPSWSWGIKFDDFLQIPGSTINDKLFTISHHRHIIDVICTWTHESTDKHLYISVVDLGETSEESELEKPVSDDGRLSWPIWTDYGGVVNLEQKIGEGWLCRTEWTKQHVDLVCEFLRSTLNNPHSNWGRVYVRSNFRANILDVKETVLHDFFEDGDISDIHGEDYFSNKYHLSFLEVMVDLNAWLAVFPSRPNLNDELDTFIAPVLCWFNRQLANPKTTKLIEDHNTFLLSKMKIAMNAIFQKCFVPLFTTPYFSRLVITSDLQSIEIKASLSSYSMEKVDHIPPEHNDVASVRDLHNEIFGKGPQADGNQLIPRSEWYPYFAAYLLNICVKYLHFPTESSFMEESYNLDFSRLFPCIVQCLPYAQTTPQNLDALRAIKHLSKEVDVKLSMPQLLASQVREFHPPSGFCSGVREFLKRYDPSALSSEELSDFEIWMRGITESEFVVKKSGLTWADRKIPVVHGTPRFIM